jgi:Acetyltransferase (GNAT) domain
MIVIEKKLKGIVPYRQIFWPTEAALKELAEHLPLTHYVRADFAKLDLDRGRCIIRHNVSLTALIDLQRPVRALYKDLMENARIRIHKAEKLGSRLTLRRYSGGPDQERLVEQFVDLYQEFVRGKATATTPASAARVRSFFPNADLILAYLDGQPVCGHLNLVDRDVSIVRMQDSANRRFDDPAIARLAGIINVYLHWYEFEKYRDEGFASYDFGSLGHLPDSVGVNRFKMQFGGTIIREHNYLLTGMPAIWRTVFGLMSRSSNWQRRVQMQNAGQRWRDMTLEQIRQTVESSIADYERGLQAKGRPANHNPNQSAPPTAPGIPAAPGNDKLGKASQPI